MALQALRDNLDGLTPEIAALYEKTETGQFLLSVDDTQFKNKIKEFRDNNTKLLKDKEELEAKMKEFGSATPEDLAKLKEYEAKVQAAEEEAKLKEGKVEEVIAQRLAKVKEDHEKQLSTIQNTLQEEKTKAEQAHSELVRVKTHTAITNAITENYEIVQGALPDILRRAEEVWTLNESGQLEAREGDGSIIFSKDGVNKLEAGEWMESLKENNPYFFKANEGGGATGSNPGNLGSGVVDGTDPAQISANLEDIASGKVQVR